jgi:hypothetical protein
MLGRLHGGVAKNARSKAGMAGWKPALRSIVCAFPPSRFAKSGIMLAYDFTETEDPWRLLALLKQKG